MQKPTDTNNALFIVTVDLSHKRIDSLCLAFRKNARSLKGETEYYKYAWHPDAEC